MSDHSYADQFVREMVDQYYMTNTEPDFKTIATKACDRFGVPLTDGQIGMLYIHILNGDVSDD